MKNQLLLLLSFLFFFHSGSAQESKNKKITSLEGYNYMHFMVEPYELMKHWGDDTLSISKYSQEELDFQDELNELNDFVYSQWLGVEYDNNNYSKPIKHRSIDNEPITPFTWKWVRLKFDNPDGSIDTVHLRRPNWWIIHQDLDSVGKSTYVSIPEIGIYGQADVFSITPNQLDTRVLKHEVKDGRILRPIIAKTIHASAEVWDYHFSNGPPVGATSNHPFFSLDQNNYVPIGEITIGERVKSLEYGEVTLVKKEVRKKQEKVYNVEVYRDHNFFVGDQALLVHNSCNFITLTENLKHLDAEVVLNAYKKTLDDLVPAITSTQRSNINKALVDLPADDAKKFLDQFSSNKDLIKAFTDKPSLVNSWDILLKEGDDLSLLLRENLSNLEKLDNYIKLEGADISRLKSSFSNTKDQQKWIDMKIPKSEFESTYEVTKNSLDKLSPWTKEHKAQRWANHKSGKPDADFQSWSNRYDGNIKKVGSASDGVDDYYKTLGWNCNNCKEVTTNKISIMTDDGPKTLSRKHDIADKSAKKAIEVKEYSSGKVYYSENRIKTEVALDAKLLSDKEFRSIEWVFKGCTPSEPLRKALTEAGISINTIPK